MDNAVGCEIDVLEVDVHPFASLTKRLYEPGARFGNVGLLEKVAPPSMLYWIGVVPPVETIWMVPFANPLQVMFVATP
jgi:hypothetical protein